MIKAAALIENIAKELKKAKHFDKQGKELMTVKEVLDCLLNEGSVTYVEHGKE